MQKRRGIYVARHVDGLLDLGPLEGAALKIPTECSEEVANSFIMLFG